MSSVSDSSHHFLSDMLSFVGTLLKVVLLLLVAALLLAPAW